MIGRTIHRMISALEKRFGVTLEYLHAMADTSRAAYFKFLLFMPMAQHRRGIGPAEFHVAGLAATLHQDCGPCSQISINEALREGVPVEYLKAVVAGDPEQLPPHLMDVYHFTKAVVEQRDDVADRRERVHERVGTEGILSLALAIAGAQVFPLVKRGMGYDLSCSLMDFSFHDGHEDAGSAEQLSLERVSA